MRAKVASKAGGHAFEERFLKMDPAQLTILFFQAVKEDREKRSDQVEVINRVNEIWDKKLTNLFELLQMFSNPKMFKAMMDKKKTEELGEEVDEDNFDVLWDEIMKVIPEEYVVEEPTATVEEFLNQAGDNMSNDKLDELITGWVSNSRRIRED